MPLISRNLDLVRILAVGEWRHRTYLDLDDLISAGNLGLVKAAERYEPSRGVPFRAYARHWILGAILDEVRGLARQWKRRPLSLDQAVDAGDAASPLGELLASPDKAEGVTLTVDALGAVSERDRNFVLARAAGFSLAEIAKAQGISEARASTIVQRARYRIEDELAA